jgi:hypothetical protein
MNQYQKTYRLAKSRSYETGWFVILHKRSEPFSRILGQTVGQTRNPERIHDNTRTRGNILLVSGNR